MKINAFYRNGQPAINVVGRSRAVLPLLSAVVRTPQVRELFDCFAKINFILAEIGEPTDLAGLGAKIRAHQVLEECTYLLRPLGVCYGK